MWGMTTVEGFPIEHYRKDEVKALFARKKWKEAFHFQKSHMLTLHQKLSERLW